MPIGHSGVRRLIEAGVSIANCMVTSHNHFKCFNTLKKKSYFKCLFKAWNRETHRCIYLQTPANVKYLAIANKGQSEDIQIHQQHTSPKIISGTEFPHRWRLLNIVNFLKLRLCALKA